MLFKKILILFLKDNNGNTPLHLAAIEVKLVDHGTSDDELPSMMNALTRCGRFNPIIQNKEGRNVFQAAVKAGNLRFV